MRSESRINTINETDELQHSYNVTLEKTLTKESARPSTLIANLPKNCDSGRPSSVAKMPKNLRVLDAKKVRPLSKQKFECRYQEQDGPRSHASKDKLERSL